MCKCWQIAALLFGLACCSATAAAVEKVSLYSDYTTAPFAVEGVAPESSYTIKLAKWLSDQSQGRYLFEARQIPRLRLNRIVARADWQGVVAWANPVWFDDHERQRFLWSAALMGDHDVLLSRQADDLFFTLQGPPKPLRLGAIHGYLYADLEPFIRRGMLLREDVHNDLSNVRKLQRGRVDVVVLQASALSSLRAQIADFDQWAAVSQVQLPNFQRFLFTSTSNTQLMAFLQQELIHMALAPEWVELHDSLSP